MAQQSGGSGTSSQQDSEGPPGIKISSLSLPTAKTAKQHLGSKKKSETKKIHPGYSMFDWNKVCTSGRDMTGTNGKFLKVTPEELATHCTSDDLWTSVRGVVYNCTVFGKYHPGGKAQLMRGAGRDCTELFDKIHIWVNSESILEKCTVGVLTGAKAPEKASNLRVGIEKPPFLGHADQDETVLSIQVPSIALQNVSTHDEQTPDDQVPPCLIVQSPQDADLAIPVPVPRTDISIPVPRTEVSVPVPSNEIFVPVPSNEVFVPVPRTEVSVPVSSNEPIPNHEISIPIPSAAPKNDNPVSRTEITPVTNDVKSIPVPDDTVPNSVPNSGLYYYSQSYRNTYISWHPLISKTAYETEV